MSCGSALKRIDGLEAEARPRDGAIETEFEVDEIVDLTDNGVTVFSANRTTVASSGSVTVARRMANRAGTDHIRATPPTPTPASVAWRRPRSESPT